MSPSIDFSSFPFIKAFQNGNYETNEELRKVFKTFTHTISRKKACIHIKRNTKWAQFLKQSVVKKWNYIHKCQQSKSGAHEYMAVIHIYLHITIKFVLSSQTERDWPLKAAGYLMQVNLQLSITLATTKCWPLKAGACLMELKINICLTVFSFPKGTQPNLIDITELHVMLHFLSYQTHTVNLLFAKKCTVKICGKCKM